MMETFIRESGVLLRTLGLAAGIALAALLVHYVVYRTLASLERRRPHLFAFDDLLLRHTRKPTQLLLPVLAVYLALPLLTVEVPEPIAAAIGHGVYFLLVVALAWLFVRLTFVLQEAVARQYTIEAADNLTARKIRTQVGIIRRLLISGIIFVALAAVLLRFEGFRQLGAGLLASAGIAGIVIGFAAQRTLGNVLAGFQIAITQPIRVDDVVVVEGEWGRIEEITLTYVVVCIWDQRRLVLPISYFIEQPFQNWTRTSAEILGTVFLHVDYTVPFEAVRAELHRLLEASDHWDGAVWRLHVTDATERTVQLRALMSARDSGTAWELRCEIREKLIDFIQREYPQALPVVRAAVEADPAGKVASIRSS